MPFHGSFIPFCLISVFLFSESTFASTDSLDKFGIKMLNKTIDGGREWFNRWNEGTQRTITWGPDVIDTEFMIRGSTTCVIFGASGETAGQIKVTGSGPRLYVRGTSSESVPPPVGTPKWNNVEITLYAKTTDAGSKVIYAGIEAVCKTNHCPDSDDTTTRGYGGRVLFDGRVDIEKELSHGKGSNIRTYPSFFWTQEDGGVLSTNSTLKSQNNNNPVYELPLNKWIGYKLVARNCDNDTNVRVEVYIDKTDGLNGGDWKLAKSIKDIVYLQAVDSFYLSKDLWYDGGDFKNKGSASDKQHGMPITNPNYSVYLRTDGNVEQYYKYFSVREIEPIHPGNASIAYHRLSAESKITIVSADRNSIIYTLQNEGKVTASIYRLDGTLVSKISESGKRGVNILRSAKAINGGLYIVKLSSERIGLTFPVVIK